MDELYVNAIKLKNEIENEIISIFNSNTYNKINSTNSNFLEEYTQAVSEIDKQTEKLNLKLR